MTLTEKQRRLANYAYCRLRDKNKQAFFNNKLVEKDFEVEVGSGLFDFIGYFNWKRYQLDMAFKRNLIQMLNNADI